MLNLLTAKRLRENAARNERTRDLQSILQSGNLDLIQRLLKQLIDARELGFISEQELLRMTTQASKEVKY